LDIRERELKQNEEMLQRSAKELDAREEELKKMIEEVVKRREAEESRVHELEQNKEVLNVELKELKRQLHTIQESLTELEAKKDKTVIEDIALTRYYKELLEEKENLYKELEKMTREQERLRIARDIHDTLGHEMTALIMQLEMASRLMDRDFEKNREAVETVKRVFGDDYDLRIDPNGVWDRNLAFKHIPLIKKHKVKIVEEPISYLDPGFIEFVGLMKSYGVILMACETVCTPEDLERIIKDDYYIRSYRADYMGLL